MLNFHQRTEVIREMIAYRMQKSPCIEDLSLSVLKTWPELLIWGTPEGTIFNIITSCYLNMQKGYDLKNAICEIEELEEGNNEKSYPTETLNTYIKYRLEKEHQPYAYLYSDDLLFFFQEFIKKKLRSYDCETFIVPKSNNDLNISSQENLPKVVNDSHEKDTKINRMAIASIAFVVIALVLVNIADINADGGEFKKIKTTDSSWEYENFINNYPRSQYVPEAYERLVTIAANDGMTSLKKFIKKYDNKYNKCPLQVEWAKLKLIDLCLSLYEKCLEVNTIECWNDYMNQVPDTEWRDAGERIDELITNKILNISTMEECDAFPDMYLRNNKYRDLLEKKRIDLFVDSFSKKGKYELLSSIQQVNAYDVERSTIVYINNMDYPLEIYYSGKMSGKQSVASGESGSISLSNGTYKIIVKTVALARTANILSYNSKPLADDLLNQKIFVGSINVNGGLYKTTYPPKIKKKAKLPPDTDLFRLFNGIR